MIQTRTRNILLCLCLVLALSGCASGLVHTGVPEELVAEAQVDGFPPNVRSWSDEPKATLNASIERRIDQYRAANAEYYKEHGRYPGMNYLALSGGGNDGAYAAGILCGWTKAGTRPEFTVVTGVSTGALIAPFAFLGAKYDDVLKQEYTTVSSDKIFLADMWTAVKGVMGGAALADAAPLKARIDKLITPELMNAIAEETRRGRRLLIITTNLEAQRGVVWNIGNIANSGNPGALDLFKKIMLASTAVPGVFSPVLIDVTAGGKKMQELHVDGGVTSQVFLFPLKSTHLDKDAFAAAKIDRTLYIIRNGKITPEYAAVKGAALPITKRSVETLIKYQGIGDLYRMYSGAERDGMAYRLTYIPASFHEASAEIFDPAYMTKLFDYGYSTGQTPDPWFKEPPGIEYTDSVVSPAAEGE